MNKNAETYAGILDQLSKMNTDVVIGEFAGRDSAAAIIKALEADDLHHVLPVATFAPTEYGDFHSLERNLLSTQKRVAQLHGDVKTVDHLLYYSNPDLWSALNGRFAFVLQEKYGFFSPCIGCHAYFHLVRLPFALKLGKKIISGERESHDGQVKINQRGPCLDVYKKITAYFGVELLMPLRHMKEGNEVVSLLGWDWEEGGSQPVYALSGSCRTAAGQVSYDAQALHRFLQDFLYPTAIELGELIIGNPQSDRKTMLQIIGKRVGE